MQIVYFKNIIKISKKNFTDTPLKDLKKKITNGTIIVVKNSINKKKLIDAGKKIHKFKMKNSKDVKMIEGIGNIFYRSQLKKSDEKRYALYNRNWYFFPWNKDKFPLSKLVQPIFNYVVKMNGYDPKKILKQTPKDGFVQRFNLMNYPNNSGYITSHVDPTSIVKITAGIYITEFGRDYIDGGYYVLDKNKKKFFVDHQVKSGDLVLFYAGMPHGVDIIKMKNKPQKNSFFNGRWFLNMTLVQSHHVKERISSSAFY